jgi:hypothetical protein
MFVTPDNEIDVIIKETLRNEFLWPMLDPAYNNRIKSFEQFEVSVPILV